MAALGAGCIHISDDELTYRKGGEEAPADGLSSGMPCGDTELGTWYADIDGDGYGDPRAAVKDCEQPTGTVANYDDCDDSDPTANIFVTWWLDEDGDGVGGAITTEACRPLDGFVGTPGDCDDTDARRTPGAVEVCDGVDNDCDDILDDDDPDLDVSTAVEFYEDADDDGVGAGDARLACTVPDGSVEVGGDCDDGDPTAFPGNSETCNDGVDNDCNGTADPCALDSLVDLDTDGDAALVSARPYAQVGGVLGGAGDLDGDGVADPVLGVPGADRWLAVAGGSALVGEIDLDDGVLAEFVGSGGSLGNQVAALGDVDGDGLGDLAVGDLAQDLGGSRAGGVWWIPGSATSIDDAWLLWADEAEAFAGTALAAGDSTADGTTDLLIGAYGQGAGGAPGAAMRVPGPVSATGTLAEAATLVVEGSWQDRAGIAVASADLDGDGVDEVIIGADRDDPSGRNNAGTVAIFDGTATGTLTLEDASVRVVGPLDSAFAGNALDAGGDVDGDGLADLLIGTPGVGDGTLSGSGAAWLLTGARTADVDLADETTWFSGTGTDELGQAVALVPDFTGDGRAEVLLGTPGTNDRDGGAWLFVTPPSGALTETDASVVFVGTVDSRTGASVATLGDVSGDGVVDFAIGAPRANTAHIVFGVGL